jgi:hypothetical protein
MILSCGEAAGVAVTIQSAFRSHLERKGLARERELQNLSLFSPSTPESNKKIRFSLQNSSKSAKKCEVILEEEENAAAPSELKALEATKPLELAVNASTSTGNITFHSNSATNTATVTLTGPLSTINGKKVAAELKKHRAILSDVKNCWTLRTKALNAIEEVARELKLSSSSPRNNQTIPTSSSGLNWPEQLELLRNCMGEQLQDLRSAIVREACRTLIALADYSPAEFCTELAFYFPLLYKGLYITIKVISNACDETLKALVVCTRSVKAIQPLVAGLLAPHNIVREKCASHLAEFLQIYNAEANLERNELENYAHNLGQAITSHITDSDGGTRAAVRRLYHEFSCLFASRASSLFNEFNGVTQRILQQEQGEKKKSSKGSRIPKRTK